MESATRLDQSCAQGEQLKVRGRGWVGWGVGWLVVCVGGSGVHVWPRESEKAREVMVLGVWGAKDWRVWQRVRG